ncbi:MAG TPA: TadE/TadG family type IV pilus assembly protein [Anaerolineae bacterium]
MGACRRRPDDSKGQGLVEFALVLPIIVLSIFAILDMGRAVYAFSTISNSARAGARVAIVDQTIATIQQSAVSQSVALGASAADVVVCFKSGTSTQQTCSQPATDPCPNPYLIGCLAIVTMNHQFTPVTPIISSIVPSIAMSSTTRMSIERVNP